MSIVNYGKQLCMVLWQDVSVVCKILQVEFSSLKVSDVTEKSYEVILFSVLQGCSVKGCIYEIHALENILSSGNCSHKGNYFYLYFTHI